MELLSAGTSGAGAVTSAPIWLRSRELLRRVVARGQNGYVLEAAHENKKIHHAFFVVQLVLFLSCCYRLYTMGVPSNPTASIILSVSRLWMSAVVIRCTRFIDANRHREKPEEMQQQLDHVQDVVEDTNAKVSDLVFPPQPPKE